MKKVLQLFLLFSFVLIFKTNGKNVEAYFNYCTFNSPQIGPYIETYLSIIGNSLHYVKTPENNFKAEIEITIIIKQNERIVDFKKFILESPLANDTINDFSNFIDQQRFSIPNGVYEIEIEIADLGNVNEQHYLLAESVTVEYPENKISVSDIQLLESYSKTVQPNILTKSGFDLVPYVSYFYPKSLQNINFYAEIYNTLKILGPDEKWVANYFIETAESNVKFSNFNTVSRKNSNEVTVIFGSFPIEKLPSGNYYLVIEARNKNNEMIAQKKVFFQRSNSGIEISQQDLISVNVENSFVEKITNHDSLAEHIRSIHPISSKLERTFAENQLHNSDLKLKQQFFHHFWKNRNSLNPEKAWLDYYENVKKVDKHYGTQIKKGYATDRGRVYLQYGPPNTISQQYNEPSAYPHEIWHYYHIENFNNRKFVFYNPDLGTNEFSLLHSDHYGENNNPRWQLVLHKRNHQIFDLDQTQPDQHFGGNTDSYYQLPR